MEASAIPCSLTCMSWKPSFIQWDCKRKICSKTELSFCGHGLTEDWQSMRRNISHWLEERRLVIFHVDSFPALSEFLYLRSTAKAMFILADCYVEPPIKQNGKLIYRQFLVVRKRQRTYCQTLLWSRFARCLWEGNSGDIARAHCSSHASFLVMIQYPVWIRNLTIVELVLHMQSRIRTIFQDCEKRRKPGKAQLKAL